jgi:hypothetical protein
MKKVLLAMAVVALLAVGVQAGELKIHNWPCSYVSQEITSIPVVMDVGYWVKIKDQDKLKIKLAQDAGDIHTFSGCVDMVVETNFNVGFSCSITATGAVPGEWSCSVNNANVTPPGGTVTVCAKVIKADLSKATGGSKDVAVATVKVKVKPI